MICPICGANYDGNQCPGCGAKPGFTVKPGKNNDKTLIIVVIAIVICSLLFSIIAGVLGFLAVKDLFEASRTAISASDNTPPSSRDHNDRDNNSTPPAPSPSKKLSGDMQSYSSTYISSADEKYETTVEPHPDGGYLITKKSEHLMSPLEMRISNDDYKEIVAHFDSYGILSKDSTAMDPDDENVLSITARSANGDKGEYLFTSQRSISQEITDFHGDLEKLYDSMGTWTFTKKLYDVPKIAEFTLIEQKGNITHVYNLANHLEDFSISEEVIAFEEVEVDKNHMQYRKYENGTSGTYSLDPLSNADMMELDSIVARHHIVDQTASESGEYISGGNVPDTHYYFAIKIQKEGEEPIVLSFDNQNSVPPECMSFYKEIAETYLFFED